MILKTTPRRGLLVSIIFVETKKPSMKRTLFFSFLACLFMIPQAEAQRFRDARSYYREFQSENRRIKIKTLRYLGGVVKGEDQRRVAKYREMVVEQLNDSERALKRLPGYKEDSVLRREYLNGIDLYQKAFEEKFKTVEQMMASGSTEYDSIMALFQAQEEGEKYLFDGAYKIEEAENFFAKKYAVDLRRDAETQELFKRIDILTVYMRDLNRPFLTTRNQVQQFITAAKEGKGDTLMDLVDQIRVATKKGLESLPQEGDVTEYDGDYDFEDALASYYEELRAATDEQLFYLAEDLSNKFLPEEEYDDAMYDLEDFEIWHENFIEEIKEEQTAVVEDYLIVEE